MIGVVGDDEAAGVVVEALEGLGANARTESANQIAGSATEAAVAIGEAALIDLVAAGVDRPVLPVGLDAGLPSVPPDAAAAATEAYLEGAATTSHHRLLAVHSAGEPAGRAVFEAMLVRSEPGRISEYSFAAAAADGRFRADGVTVATPAGSHGYSHAAGGPRLGLGTEAVVVVPVAAFGLGAPTWVLDPEAGLDLRVERDEGDVSLLVDGRERQRLAGSATVSIRPGSELEVIEPPAE